MSRLNRAMRKWRHVMAARRRARSLPTPLMRARTERFAAYLKGKRVTIVGPASSIVGSARRALIESHDVVARINHALPVDATLVADVGQRTDVLYHNMDRRQPRAIPIAQLADLVAAEVQWVCAAYPYLHLEHDFAADIDAFREALADRVPLHIVDARRFLDTRRKLGTRPNAGVNAILDLLSFGISALYITGFTFYDGGNDYHDGYPGMGPGRVHEQSRQKRLLARLVRTDTRIRVDPTLERILLEEQGS